MSVRKYEYQNMLDFILTNLGDIESNLFTFMESQLYTSYVDFDDLIVKKINVDPNSNIITDFYKEENEIVATKHDPPDTAASFDYSFDLSFES